MPCHALKKSDFHYELPEELIAQAPLPERSASRLLLVPPGDGAFSDLHVRDLPDLLQPGDLLVFNDTRVIPARLFGQKDSGGRVEILIERLLPDEQARAQVRASKSPKAGSWIVLDGGGRAEVLGREGEFYLLRFEVEDGLEPWLLRVGRLPLVPYRAGPGRGLIELPLSTAFTGLLRGAGRSLYNLARKADPAAGALARSGLLRRVPLTPEGIEPQEAVRVIDQLLDLGLRVLNLSFHSPSLEPGHTPYVRDAEDLWRFYRWWDMVLGHMARRGITCASQDELLAAIPPLEQA